MNKFIKTTGWLLSAIVVIAIVTVIVLVTFVSPNTFKPIISAQVLKYTGRQLTIEGDLSWTFFPYLGFKVGHMTLNNPPGFQDKVFAEINDATVGVKLLPILRANIQTNQINLSGLTLHLIKNAQGASNWRDLQTLRESPQNFKDIEKAQATGKKMSVTIPSIDIADSTVVWEDEQTHQTATISHLELHAKDINLEHHFFPVTARFDFSAPNATTGHAKLQGDFKLDLNEQLCAINNIQFSVNAKQQDQTISADLGGNLTADMTQQMIKVQQFKSHITQLKGIKAPLDINAEVSANLKEHSIALNNVAAQLANLELAATITINNYNEAAQLAGHLQTKPFDLKKFLQAIGQDNPDLQNAKMLTANVDFTDSPIGAAALTLQGKITLDELQAAKIVVSHLLMDANLKNRVLELNSIAASLYQGNLQGAAKIDFVPGILQISLQAKLNGVQIQPLLQDLGHQQDKLKLKGAGDINLQMTSSGLDANSIIRNLNGTFNFVFNNGQIQGVNLGYLIDSAYALVKQQSPPAMGDDVTNFGQLTGTGVIQNGVITNKDLLLDSPRLTSKGEGTIDLTSQKINYSLKTTAHDVAANHNDKDLSNLYSLGIPITISGDLSNPAIRINAQAMLQEVAEQQVQKIKTKVGEKLSDQIKNNIPGKASD
ncbi:MAG: AsmA family protein, partial [Pseudomonadota bacterium]